MASNSQFVLKDFPSSPEIVSAVKFCPFNNSKLLASSWDNNLYVFDINADEGGQLLGKFKHRAVVLDACWGSSEDEVFTCGADHDVRRVNLQTANQDVLSTHVDVAARVHFDAGTSTLFSISFKKELHVHDIAPGMGPTGVAAKLQLPNEALAMGASQTKLIVAMTKRLTHIYDIPALALLSQQSSKVPPNLIEAEPFQSRDASLKYLTIGIAGMPDDKGYVTSSIEGRVAVDWFDESAEVQARKYAFKCHRDASQEPDENGKMVDVDMVHPVHALAFNPRYGTFASGGQDGTVALWDAVQKRRIRQYQKFGNCVKNLSFSADGKYLAIAVCPGIERRSETWNTEQVSKGEAKIFIRELAEGEAAGKAGKK